MSPEAMQYYIGKVPSFSHIASLLSHRSVIATVYIFFRSIVLLVKLGSSLAPKRL